MMNVSWDNISDAIMHFGVARPDMPAVVEGPVTVDYHAFADLVRRASAYCGALGVSAGQPVGVCLFNSIDHLVLYLGLLRVGAVAVEISPAMPAAEKAEIIRRLGIGLLFSEPDSPPAAVGREIRIAAGWRQCLERFQGDVPTRHGAEISRTITLTSGSTGRPRAIVSSHSQRMVRAAAYQALFGDCWSEDKPAPFLLLLSIANSGFNHLVITQILMGGTVVVLPEFSNASDFVRAIVAHGDAVSLVTSNMCRALLSHAADSAVPLCSARAIVSIGSPLFADEKRAMVERVTPNFHEIYGASGFGIIAGLRPADMADHAGSVGRPALNADVEIVDDDGNVLSPGQIGRVRCRGPAVALGMAGDDDSNFEERFRDEAYYTGDIGLFDDMGFLTLKGRYDTVIWSGGHHIYTLEIEAAITAHPAVKEVAVVGVPRPGGGGEQAAAVVVLGTQVAHGDLAAHCARHLPARNLPSSILYADTLPKTPGGKVDRAAVRRLCLSAGR